MGEYSGTGRGIDNDLRHTVNILLPVIVCEYYSDCAIKMEQPKMMHHFTKASLCCSSWYMAICYQQIHMTAAVHLLIFYLKDKSYDIISSSTFADVTEGYAQSYKMIGSSIQDAPKRSLISYPWN
jgi:hypothetical protein